VFAGRAGERMNERATTIVAAAAAAAGDAARVGRVNHANALATRRLTPRSRLYSAN